MPDSRIKPLRRRDATLADLSAAAAWVTSQRECELWAGPGVAYPVDLAAFAEQTGFAGAVNVALDDEHGLAAFGQSVSKGLGRAHLARVIVRPDARGRRVGRALVEELVRGAREGGASRVTLNVSRDNAAAAALYARLGFRVNERPRDDDASPDAHFMQRDIAQPSGAAGAGAPT